MTDNPPAFPSENIERGIYGKEYGRAVHSGMSMRDYFAGQALMGICASGPSREWTNGRLARESYDIAESMLKARENSNG